MSLEIDVKTIVQSSDQGLNDVVENIILPNLILDVVYAANAGQRSLVTSKKYEVFQRNKNVSYQYTNEMIESIETFFKEKLFGFEHNTDSITILW